MPNMLDAAMPNAERLVAVMLPYASSSTMPRMATTTITA
jgi:hypothetical protein